MRGKWFAAGLLAAVGLLAWAVPSRAGDVIRLNMVDNAPTQNLVDDGQGADTVRTWYRGFGGWGGYRGFGWGGYRGFGWGGYRGFGWGGYGLGYRGFGYGGFYRPYYGFGGFYRPFYGYGGYGLGYGLGVGYGLGGIGYGGFYPGFGYGYGFGPCAGTTASVYTLSMPVATIGTPLPCTPQQPYVDVNPPQAPADAGTYPYDGGPQPVVPAPKESVKPSTGTPQRSVPLEGRSVSLPKPTTKWAYPAYGETARRITAPSDQTVLTRGESKKPASR